MDVRSVDQILQEKYVSAALAYYSVRSLRYFPPPQLTDVETEPQRRSHCSFCPFLWYSLSAAHVLITSPSLSSDLPKCSLESWEVLILLKK